MSNLQKANNEVVAFLIDGYVTNDLNDIIGALKHCNRFEYITRAMANFMGCLDLGKNWENLANAPVLFGLDENNNPVFIENGLLKLKVPESAKW